MRLEKAISRTLVPLEYARRRPEPHHSPTRQWASTDVVFFSLYSFAIVLVSFLLCFGVGHP